MSEKHEEQVNTQAGMLKKIRLLGKGKSGYSWLAEGPAGLVVLKEFHDEPCPYYKFTNKLRSELEAHDKLKGLISIPRLIAHDADRDLLVKEYIEGPTAAELVAKGELPENSFPQIFSAARALREAGLNIDYFPTNFVMRENRLYYVDYECNPYSDEWNFPNWGIYYWLNREGMDKFLRTGDASGLNANQAAGKPYTEPFSAEARRLSSLYA